MRMCSPRDAVVFTFGLSLLTACGSAEAQMEGDAPPSGGIAPGGVSIPGAAGAGDPAAPAGAAEPGASPTPRPQQRPSGARAIMGQNLANATYYSGNWPFVDAMKGAEPFASGTTGEWRDGRPLDTDPQGWVRALAPDQLARSFVLGKGTRDATYPIPAGEYVVLYEGEGELRYGAVPVVSRAPGRDVLQLSADQELILEIAQVNPANHLRNIRVLMPGGSCDADPFTACDPTQPCASGTCRPFEETYAEQPFHPEFLAEQRPFGVVRFMDWMRVNRLVHLEDGVGEQLPVVEWDEYTQREDAFWGPVPVSVIVQLANTLKADPWINIPHSASDAFVREVAKVVKEELDPSLRVYVEYSNEVWNLIFDQTHWAGAEGCRRLSSNPEAECRRPGDETLCQSRPGWDEVASTCMEYMNRYYGRRTGEVMNLFERELGGADRLVRVLGTQMNTIGWRALPQLDDLWNGSEPLSAKIDAIAIAPYFAGGMKPQSADEAFLRNDVEVNGWPAGTFRMLTGEPGDPHVLNWVQRDVEALAARPDLGHIELITYEGGQHLDSLDAEEVARYYAYNRDPRMKEVFLQLFDFWHQMSGGALFVHYKSGGSNIWGVKSYQGQPREQAPKYDAILTHIEQLEAGGSSSGPAR